MTNAPCNCSENGLDDFASRLTDAAHHVALAHGSAGPFVDLELDVWRTLRRTLANPMPAVH
jgi:hypothetical protein